MNFKKFISGVSALTIAASSFAAMAVTASAADYTDVVVSPANVQKADKVIDETSGEWEGLWKTAGNSGNNFSLALADLSGLTDIDRATSVTVEFDTMLRSGGSSRMIFGLGDKTVRGTNANGSSKSTYNRDGIAMYLGTGNGTAYYINGGGTNLASAFDHTVHVSVTLDRSESKYSYVVTDTKNGNKLQASDISTAVSNITVIEAYSWQNNMTYGFSDVTVSYTVPETPTHNYTINAVDGSDNVLATIASGMAAEGFKYSTDVNEVIAANDTYYQLDSSVTGYNVEYTMGNADATQGVLYNENSDIVGYMNAGHANAANSASGYTELGTLPAGNYKVTAALKERPDRGIYIRNKGVNDTGANIITNFGIGKTSAAGVYTEEFTLTEETTVAVTGFSTSGSTEKTNQSAEFYYVIVEFVSEYVPPVPVVSTSVEDFAVYSTGDGYTADAVVGSIQLDVSEVAIDLSKATYKGNEPTSFEGENVTTFLGSALIIVVINDETDPAALDQVVFN